MIKENYYALLKKVGAAAERAGRDPGLIKIVAVTKAVSSLEIKEAMELGLKDFGENRYQEAVKKIKSLPSHLNWHFIGHLQTNKAHEVMKNFKLIHSLDRLKLARELNRCGEKEQKSVPVLVQVNVSGEKSKHGLAPEEVNDFLIQAKELSFLQIQGLMTIAPLVEDPEETRPFFRRLKELKDRISIPGIFLRYLSMGMSNDFQVAIEEGADLIRVGTVLFGPRS